MDLKLTFPPETTFAVIKHLEKELRKNEGIQKVEIPKGEWVQGSMGVEGGFVNALVAVITAAQAPLTELVKCLATFIADFKTDVTIQSGDKSVKISGRKPQELETFIKSTLESFNK